jgi:hypothetical protein
MSVAVTRTGLPMRLVAEELLMVLALVACPETMVSIFLDRSSMEALMFWVPSRLENWAIWAMNCWLSCGARGSW